MGVMLYSRKPDSSMTRTFSKPFDVGPLLSEASRNAPVPTAEPSAASSRNSQFEKHETSPPTVSNEALLLPLMIDAYEGRYVATADVAGAYLHADMPDYVLFRFIHKDAAF